LKGALNDFNGSAGANGEVFSSTGSGSKWISSDSLLIGANGEKGTVGQVLTRSATGVKWETPTSSDSVQPSITPQLIELSTDFMDVVTVDLTKPCGIVIITPYQFGGGKYLLFPTDGVRIGFSLTVVNHTENSWNIVLPHVGGSSMIMPTKTSKTFLYYGKIFASGVGLWAF
jgi:hypothetical protein